MKQIILLNLLIWSVLSSSCQNTNETVANHYLVNKLEKAENSRDIQLIESIFAEDVVLYSPDMPPVSGKAAVVSIYNFVFSRQDKQTAEYRVDSTYEEGNKRIELGINITKKFGQAANKNEFKAVFKQVDKEYKIAEIYFGKEEDIKREIPSLPKPTGEYKVGQSTYFYDKANSGNNRLLSFQIWYPSEVKADNKAAYRSKEVVEASASFLGFPFFVVSYFSLIESNSYLNASAFPNKKFPVLLYNHGYGGFTSVYQTVFEDLASHGYIVVSIGHEDESCLLIVEEGVVIANSPENEFYRKRSPELNGSTIGQWQNIILNSDDVNENRKAYQEMIKITPLHNESTRLWQSDTKAAYAKLEQLNKTDKNLNGAFDFDAVGAFGHSVGGATAGQLAYSCSATKAAINLDGFQFGDLVNNKLKVPFMFVSSNREGNRYLRASSFMDDSEADCYQVAIKGFSHDNFTDLKYIMEGDSRMIELQRELIRSFFDKYLKEKDVKLDDLEKEYTEISIDRNE